MQTIHTLRIKINKKVYKLKLFINERTVTNAHNPTEVLAEFIQTEIKSDKEGLI